VILNFNFSLTFDEIHAFLLTKFVKEIRLKTI